MRWSIEELIKYWGYYSERNIWIWFRNFFHNTKRRIKLLLRWIFKGYCAESMWSLDDYFSEVILFRLKKFRKYNTNSYPSNMTSEEWEKTIDTLIEKFEILINRSIENKVAFIDHFLEKSFNPIQVHEILKKEREERLEIYAEQSKNDEEAINLFAKVYFDLWD